MAIAALVTWIVTAAFGFFMLGTWISRGGARAGGPSHFRPPVVLGHFALAAAGLVVWILYVLSDTHVLAWAAFADLLAVAVIGDLLVLRWTKDRRAGLEGSGASPVVGRHDRGATMTVRPASVQLAEQRIPPVAVVAHGLFAVTTVVLVLLVALGLGGS